MLTGFLVTVGLLQDAVHLHATPQHTLQHPLALPEPLHTGGDHPEGQRGAGLGLQVSSPD